MKYISLKNIILEDNKSLIGGTSFAGETLNDFICENALHNKTLPEINEVLKQCGIKEIIPDQIIIVGNI